MAKFTRFITSIFSFLAPVLGIFIGFFSILILYKCKFEQNLKYRNYKSKEEDYEDSYQIEDS